MDGIKTSRSAKRCTEHFDVKAISSVGIHTWEVKHTTLTTRTIPKRNLPRPVAEAPPLADEPPSQEPSAQDLPPAGPVVIQGGDPGPRAGPTRTTYLEGKARKEQAAQKRKAEEELEQEHPGDEAGSDPSSSSNSTKEMEAASEEELIPDSAMASELLSARGPPQLRKQEFEEVGTGSKIPKVDSPTKRYPPFNVGRVVYEHNDEELPDPEQGTDIFWEDTYSDLGDSDEEDLFGNEDSGPPSLTEEQLQELDREAMLTEIQRLTEMQAVSRRPLQELEREEEREDGEERTQGTKWLTTKFVFDWRFRNGRWIRRARLVAREFRGQEVRNDTFSPATSASLVRLIPVLGLQQEHSLYSVDVKDAFLQVPQKTRCACHFPKEYLDMFGTQDPNCNTEGLLLLRVLPGQRDAALLWSDHFAGTLKKQNFDRSIACPTLFRDDRNSILVVHVDDIQAAGKSSSLEPKLAKLRETYELKVEGPFLTEQELEVGESHQTIRFLKRKFSYHNHELHITSDPKYLAKLKEELKLTTKASKPTPCTQEVQEQDKTQPLDQEQAGVFRKCVGILLYISQDRPDMQFSVRGLASKMSEPTFASYKALVHLVQYMSRTEGYHLVYRKTPRGTSQMNDSIRNGSYDFSGTSPKEHHLLEVFSDSDWAGRKDSRRSTSSGTVFLDGQLIYSFSRSQKSVSLSSGEAEYYAGASAASDSILLKEAITFLTQRNCRVNLHMDSSAARGIITRQGVGRVKHLQIRTLFLQDLHKQGTISVHPVGTKDNTADIGTKPLSGKRIRLLMHWLGFQTSENEPVGKEELKEHRSKEQAKAVVRAVKAKGTLAFAALLFSGLASVSEGLQFQSVKELQFQQESFQEQWFSELEFSELQKEFCFRNTSACVQDGMCSDTSACALGSDTSACALGTRVGTVMCESANAEMLSQLKNLGVSLLSRQGTDLSETKGTKIPQEEAMSEQASSSKSAKEQKGEMETLKETMELSNSLLKELSQQNRVTTQRLKELTDENKNVRWQLQEMQDETSRGRNEIESRLSNVAHLVDQMQEQFKELSEDLFYTKEQEEEAEKEKKDREAEGELRREGHGLGTTSRATSPTSSKEKPEEYEEWSDRAFFDKLLEESQAEEDYGENPNERYTQSFVGPDGDYPTETQEGKEEKTEEEQEEERRRKIKEINEKSKERQKEKEKEEERFPYPYDYTDEWKIYVEDGEAWRQHRVTGEKVWLGKDVKYKHLKGTETKGKGKEKKEGEGKAGKAKERKQERTTTFQPRDEEDRKYWERMDKLEEEKRQKRAEEAERLRKEEEDKEFARKVLEEAAEEQERRDAAAAAAEEKKRQKEEEEKRKAAEELEALEKKEQERKQKEKEARKRREHEQKENAKFVARKQEEKRQEQAGAATTPDNEDRLRRMEEMMERMMEERKQDKERIKELEEEVRSKGLRAPSSRMCGGRKPDVDAKGPGDSSPVTLLNPGNRGRSAKQQQRRNQQHRQQKRKTHQHQKQQQKQQQKKEQEQEKEKEKERKRIRTSTAQDLATQSSSKWELDPKEATTTSRSTHMKRNLTSGSGTQRLHTGTITTQRHSDGTKDSVTGKAERSARAKETSTGCSKKSRRKAEAKENRTQESKPQEQREQAAAATQCRSSK